MSRPTLLFLVTEDWYFCSHRLPVARAARDAGWRVVVATRVAEHGARIEAEGFELRPIGLRRRSMSPLRELRAVLELVRLYRRERPQLVHHVALKPVLYGTLAALAGGVPRVINAVAGLGFVFSSSSPRARALRPLVRAAFRFVLTRARVRVVVQNDDDASVLARVGVPRARVSVIAGSGVDLQRFAPLPEPAGSTVVVTMVSRMLEDKGVRELVAAARLLARERDDVSVWLVGPPDPDNPASIPERVLRQWCEEGVVRWCPGTDDVVAVWAASHVAVLPSYREGLPLSLVEAAACARPIVTTDVPGCRDVVVDARTGILVPPRDAPALARAIARLAGDPALRRRLGAAARARAQQRFGEDRVVAATLALYRAAP